jgi:hypothetical protein
VGLKVRNKGWVSGPHERIKKAKNGSRGAIYRAYVSHIDNLTLIALFTAHAFYYTMKSSSLTVPRIGSTPDHFSLQLNCYMT